MGFVYFARGMTSGLIKIGFTTQPEQRIAALTVRYCERCDPVLFLTGDFKTERRFHVMFRVSPTAQDGSRGNTAPRPQDTGVPLSQQVVVMSGPPEPMEKRGALNPEFVCWLMGFPAEWVSCGVSAMQSTRVPPQRSSKRRTKPSVQQPE